MAAGLEGPRRMAATGGPAVNRLLDRILAWVFFEPPMQNRRRHTLAILLVINEGIE